MDRKKSFKNSCLQHLKENEKIGKLSCIKLNKFFPVLLAFGRITTLHTLHILQTDHVQEAWPVLLKKTPMVVSAYCIWCINEL